MHHPLLRSLAGLLALALAATAAQSQSIVTGARHGLALQADGTVLAWGDNRLGQLGQERTLYAEVAREIPLPAKAVAVRTSTTNALVLDDQGNIWSWGTNRRGELGDGTRADRPTPQIVFRNAAQIVVNGGASSPTFVLDRDGQPWQWGPLPGGGEALAPVQSAQVPARLVKLVPRGATVAALDDQGVLWSWGEGVACADSPAKTGPVAMRGLPPLKDFGLSFERLRASSLSGAPTPAGAGTPLSLVQAVDRDGKTWKWGSEAYYGFMGYMPGEIIRHCPPVPTPNVADWTSPVAPVPLYVPPELVRAGVVITRVLGMNMEQAVASNNRTTLGLTQEGDLWQWRSQGPGVKFNREASDVVDAGNYSSWEGDGTLGLVYVTKGGKVYAKGSNIHLHLGIPSSGVDARAYLQKVPLPGPAVSVHAHTSGSYALLKDGRVFHWGYGAAPYDPFAGINHYTVPQGPAQLAIPMPVVKLAVGQSRWMALAADGEVWSIDPTAIANEYRLVDFFQPIRVTRASGLPVVKDIVMSGSGGKAAILGVDGTLWSAAAAAVAYPDISTRPLVFLPFQFGGLPPIRQVAIAAGRFGEAHFALDGQGQVWFRGRESYGLSGAVDTGTPTGLDVPAPFVRPLPGKAVSVHAGGGSFCAVLEDGSAQCYGKIFREHLGMRFTLHAPIREVSIGADGALGGTVHFRLAGGAVWAWGQGQWGQLGSGAHAHAFDPVPVVSESGSSDLDLDPGTPNSAAPARPPFRVKTQLVGNLRALSLRGDVFGSAGTPAGSNVYAMAVPASGASGLWVQLDAQGQWGPLRWPVPAVASNVQLTGESQSAALANILQQFPATGLEGLRIYIGYGRDVEEMLAARRLRAVLDIAADPCPENLCTPAYP
ncbi:RCC1 domain-containing protein [Acidovorax sp.]|uniref:RCC1 domain-containing protein n=1 Tax=Acidovorax sp. TaxID=1872122 RepID=UPI00391F017A